MFIVELRVDELRQRQGISWAELSRRSGIGKGTLSEIKNGQKRTLSADQERKLSAALNVEITELYTETVEWE